MVLQMVQPGTKLTKPIINVVCATTCFHSSYRQERQQDSVYITWALLFAKEPSFNWTSKGSTH